jgi:hypothetical protein
MFLGSRARPVGRADNITAICEPIVQKCAILNILQRYRPPRPVTGIAFYYLHYNIIHLFVFEVILTLSATFCFINPDGLLPVFRITAKVHCVPQRGLIAYLLFTNNPNTNLHPSFTPKPFRLLALKLWIHRFRGGHDGEGGFQPVPPSRTILQLSFHPQHHKRKRRSTLCDEYRWEGKEEAASTEERKTCKAIVLR